jgi:dihydrofolate reductase
MSHERAKSPDNDPSAHRQARSARLESGGGYPVRVKGVQVHGSGNLVRWLLDDQLVDEITLLTYPVVVGQGTRLSPDTGPDTAFELVAEVVRTLAPDEERKRCADSTALP